MNPDDLVVMGRASGAFGLRGEIRLYPFSEDPAVFSQAEVLLVGPHPNQTRTLTPESLRRQGKRLLLRAREIGTREEAEQLKGCWVYLRRQDLPPLPDDQYYWFELKGAVVKTSQGQTLGTVKNLMDTGAHDLLVVADQDGREVLIPVTRQIVTKLDVKGGLVIVDPPEGLIEAQLEGGQGAKGAKGLKGGREAKRAGGQRAEGRERAGARQGKRGRQSK